MIYYVEDDTNIRDLVVYTLNHSELETKGFDKASFFFEQCDKEIPSLVLLDIMLPDMDGLEILKKMKNTKTLCNIPVIMITAKTGELNTIIGLDSGADDYISKPFSMIELVSRVKALLRRSKINTDQPQENTSSDNEIIFGKLKLNQEKHIISYDDKKIELTHKEFDLLVFFMKNPDIVFDRERLLETVWGYSCGFDTRTVDVHIQSLRNKLNDGSFHLQTIRGFGYKFIGE